MGKMARTAVGARALAASALLLLVAGCSAEQADPAEESETSAPVTTDFNLSSAGTVRGQVTWEGEPPVVPPFDVRANLVAEVEWLRHRQVRPNPNAPVVHPSSRAVAGAVVFLRGVEPGRSRPWDLPPVRVEQRGGELHVVQGPDDTRVGFVRRGDGVEMVSKDPVFHALRCSGAAFFTLAFPDPNQLLTRRLKENGLVELTSGTCYYWMRAYLFVDDHPYYAHTDAAGRFELPQVPPGRYTAVCWLPNWKKARHERDPETALIARITFGRPAEKTRDVSVGPGETREINFRVAAGDFAD